MSGRMVEKLFDNAMERVTGSRPAGYWFSEATTAADLDRIESEAESVAMQTLEAIRGVGETLHLAAQSDAGSVEDIAADVGTAVVLLAELMDAAMLMERAVGHEKYRRRLIPPPDGPTIAPRSSLYQEPRPPAPAHTK